MNEEFFKGNQQLLIKLMLTPFYLKKKKKKLSQNFVSIFPITATYVFSSSLLGYYRPVK